MPSRPCAVQFPLQKASLLFLQLGWCYWLHYGAVHVAYGVLEVSPFNLQDAQGVGCHQACAYTIPCRLQTVVCIHLYSNVNGAHWIPFMMKTTAGQGRLSPRPPCKSVIPKARVPERETLLERLILGLKLRIVIPLPGVSDTWSGLKTTSLRWSVDLKITAKPGSHLQTNKFRLSTRFQCSQASLEKAQIGANLAHKGSTEVWNRAHCRLHVKSVRANINLIVEKHNYRCVYLFRNTFINSDVVAMATCRLRFPDSVDA